MPHSLVLINPWIYDFAAYDLWSKPLGLLYLGACLRDCGFDIHLIDCMNVHHPAMMNDPSRKAPQRRRYGTGKFWREKIPRPHPLKSVERLYSRYGISPGTFQAELKRIKKPSAFLVTSLMTYWYPGVSDVIAYIKEAYPGVPVILGGIYATLCRDHAVRNSGADHVVTGSRPADLFKILESHDIPASDHLPEKIPYPAFDLLTRIDYVCLLTSRGCPYRCQYCASHFLDPELLRREPLEILNEIRHWHRDYGIRDFAFYDDALLVDSDTHTGVLLKHLSELALDLRFHTPNALHVKEITPDIAERMHRTGFRTIRLGLETADFTLHSDMDNKVSEGDFERAVRNLLKAGFKRHEIGAYMLVGLPGQSVNSVTDTIRFVAAVGAMPFLAEYSPIPHTALWDKAVRHSELDLASEPLFHNNTLLPCWNDSQKKEMPKLRQMVLEVRQTCRRTA